MICIVNVGPFDGTGQGKCKYEVRINYDLVTTFTHTRSDGMARCLELAAQAVRNHDLKLYMEITK